jgi:16S rRNA A1518/A1519 N6-dimethyltransferase RsmA/KsgA/DIM1 with predicted DNA glycosylase/AP lyase activity
MLVAKIIAFICILVSFLFFVSTFWPNAKGAPWVPTRLKKARKMLEMANIQPDEVIYDLGCGDGRIIVMAARKFNAQAVGVEIELIKYLWCQLLITILGLRKKVKVVRGDLFKQDISQADIVFCYLLQSTNDRLEEKLKLELQPKTRVVSNTFLFHNLSKISEDDYSGIYVYEI